MKQMIDAGAAGVHFEDQLSSAKKCGPHGRQGAGPDPGCHQQAGGRPPCGDVSNVPTVLLARTDAESATC